MNNYDHLISDANLVAAGFVGGDAALFQAAFMMGMTDEEAKERLKFIKKERGYKKEVAVEAATILERRRRLNLNKAENDWQTISNETIERIISKNERRYDMDGATTNKRYFDSIFDDDNPF